MGLVNNMTAIVFDESCVTWRQSLIELLNYLAIVLLIFSNFHWQLAAFLHDVFRVVSVINWVVWNKKSINQSPSKQQSQLLEVDSPAIHECSLQTSISLSIPTLVTNHVAISDEFVVALRCTYTRCSYLVSWHALKSFKSLNHTWYAVYLFCGATRVNCN